MPKQIDYTDFIKSDAIQTLIADLKKLEKQGVASIDALKVSAKGLATALPKGGITSGVIKNQQQLTSTISKLKSAQGQLNQIYKTRVQLEKQLITETARQTKKNVALYASVVKAKQETKRLRDEQLRLTQTYRKSGGLVKSLTKSMLALGATYLGINVLFNSIKRLTTSIFETTKKLSALDFAIKTVITSQSELADTQQFLLGITKRYGLELISTTQSYTRFRAAVKSSNLTIAQTQQIFNSVAKAGATLGLSQQRLELAFLALEQIASKGTVSMEELRRQLGDQIPGAVNIMAEALGLSIPKLYEMIKANKILAEDALPKFAEQLEITFGIEAVNRVDTLVAAQNRLKTSWQEYVKAIKADPAFQSLFNNLNKLIQIQVQATRTPEENAIEFFYENASKKADEYTKSLKRNASQQEKILKAQIKATKELNNVEQEGSDIYEANVKYIEDLESALVKLKKTGKKELTEDEYIAALTKETARANYMLNKYNEAYTKTANKINTLKGEAKYAKLFDPEKYKELSEEIEDENERLDNYFAKRAWFTTYADKLYTDLNESIINLEDYSDDVKGIIEAIEEEMKQLVSEQSTTKNVGRIEEIQEELEYLAGYIDFLKKGGKLDLKIELKDTGVKINDLEQKFEKLGDEGFDELVNYFKDREQLLRDFGVILDRSYENEVAILKRSLAEKTISEKDYSKVRVGLWLKYNRKIIQQANIIVNELANALLYFNDIAIQEAEKNLQIHNDRIAQLESTLSTEQRLKEEGKNNDVERVRTQLAEEKALRKKALDDFQKAKKREAYIQLAAQTSSIITATANIFEQNTKLGPLGWLAAVNQIAAMLAAFASFKAKISASSVDAPGYAEGTEYLERGNAPKGRDKILIKADEGERIIKAKDNRDHLRGISNEKLMDIVDIYKLNLPSMNQNYELSGWSLLANEMKSGNDINRQILAYHKKEGDRYETEDAIIFKTGNTTKIIRKS